MVKQDICNFSLEELKGFLEDQNQRPFHAKQLFSWIYQKNSDEFDLMINLPSGLRSALKNNFYFSGLTAKEVRESSDGTKKFLFKLEDGSFIESALIPSDKRNTACLSTQVGCRFCCKFCASGITGFKRNLSTAEIINQLIFIQKHSAGERVSHIVFMGTGEPLDNYDNVLKAIRILNSSYGFNIGARRITISTSGIIPAIKKLAKEDLQIELSVSLHAADNKTRDMLMPVNKKYPLKDLIDGCRQYYLLTKRQVTFEYILIHNLNCGLDSANKLNALLKGFDTFDGAQTPPFRADKQAPLSINPEPVERVDFKLNLIPYNKIENFDFEPPAKLEVLFFQNQLSKAGIKATLRIPRGRDINAACGQLRYYSGVLRLSDRW